MSDTAAPLRAALAARPELLGEIRARLADGGCPADVLADLAESVPELAAFRRDRKALPPGAR